VTTFLFFRQALAEWKPVCALVRQTRLGLWLAVIGLGAVGLGRLVDGASLPALILGVALTTTVTAAAVLAGPHAGRVTAMTLRHPASPLALALGRWLAVTGLAGVVTLGAGVGAAWQVELGWRDGVDAALSAAGVTVPVAACGLLVTAELWRRWKP
jgi:hypothetical protein